MNVVTVIYEITNGIGKKKLFLTSEVGSCAEVTYTECCEGRSVHGFIEIFGKLVKERGIQQKLLAQ